VFRHAQLSSYTPHEFSRVFGILAEAQPNLFYRLLAQAPQGFALSVLKRLAICCEEADQLSRSSDVVIIATDVVRTTGLSEEELFRREIRRVAGDLSKYDQSASDKARSLARAALDFILVSFPQAVEENAQPEKRKIEP
jgi:hypothetical protein